MNIFKYLALTLFLFLKKVESKRHFEPRYTKDYIRRRNKEQQPLAEMEEYLYLDELESYHDDKNNPKWEKRYPILKITRKYYQNSTSKIPFKQFMNLATDYYVYKLSNLHFNLSVDTIHKLKTLFRGVVRHELDPHHPSATFNFSVCYDFLLGNQYVILFHIKVKLSKLPKEFQEKLRELHDDKTDHQFFEMFNGYDLPQKDQRDLKMEELKRRHTERYANVEWSKDGRRVIDEDYDDLEPKNERKGYHFKKKKQYYLKEDEINELLEMDL